MIILIIQESCVKARKYVHASRYMVYLHSSPVGGAGGSCGACEAKVYHQTGPSAILKKLPIIHILLWRYFLDK